MEFSALKSWIVNSTNNLFSSIQFQTDFIRVDFVHLKSLKPWKCSWNQSCKSISSSFSDKKKRLCFVICPDFVESEHKSLWCNVFLVFSHFLGRWFCCYDLGFRKFLLCVCEHACEVNEFLAERWLKSRNKTQQKKMVIIIAFGWWFFLSLHISNMFSYMLE